MTNTDSVFKKTHDTMFSNPPPTAHRRHRRRSRPLATTPTIRSSRGCSERTSAGSGTSAGTGVCDDEPTGTGEADGHRDTPGEETG